MNIPSTYDTLHYIYSPKGEPEAVILPIEMWNFFKTKLPSIDKQWIDLLQINHTKRDFDFVNSDLIINLH